MKVSDAIEIFDSALQGVAQKLESYNKRIQREREKIQQELEAALDIIKQAEAALDPKSSKKLNLVQRFQIVEKSPENQEKAKVLSEKLRKLELEVKSHAEKAKSILDDMKGEMGKLRALDKDQAMTFAEIQALFNKLSGVPKDLLNAKDMGVVGELKRKGFVPSASPAVPKDHQGLKGKGLPTVDYGPAHSVDDFRNKDFRNLPRKAEFPGAPPPFLRKGFERDYEYKMPQDPGTPPPFLGKTPGGGGKKFRKKPGDNNGKGKNPLDSNSNPKDEWQSFFNQDDIAKFTKETVIDKNKLGSIPNVTADEFKNHFENLGKKISDFKGADATQVFSVEKNSSGDAYYVGRNGATAEKDKKIVELKHVPSDDKDPTNPRPGKIDIVLHDPAMRDDSLYMMVVAAKDTLEKMGKSEFHIENCKDKPEIALKLFLIGKSLGLDPKFKDGMTFGDDTQTFKSIQNPNPAILLKVKGETTEKTMLEIYHEAKTATPERALELIKSLERKGPAADLTAKAGVVPKASVTSSPSTPAPTHGVTAKDLANSSAIPAPPPIEGLANKPQYRRK